MKAKKRIIGILLMVFGFISVLSAVGLNFYNMWEENQAGQVSAQTSEDLITLINERRAENRERPQHHVPLDLNGDSEIETETLTINGAEYIGMLVIPYLDLVLPINSTWSYAKLRNTPCRYAGSIEDNTLVIAAHNYRTHFGNIASLRDGDEVIIIDVFGTEHNYSVVGIIEVEPTDAHYVVGTEYDLTLFTCTYSGQARIVVKCMRTEPDEIASM